MQRRPTVRPTSGQSPIVLHTDAQTTTEPVDRTELPSAVSNLLVQLLREYTGRGPTQARTYIAGEVVTVIMRDTLTRGERSLVDRGQGDHVRATRKMYQDAMAADAIAGVERLSGRRVVAFLSDNHLDPDLAAEVFVIEPETY